MWDIGFWGACTNHAWLINITRLFIAYCVGLGDNLIDMGIIKNIELEIWEKPYLKKTLRKIKINVQRGKKKSRKNG